MGTFCLNYDISNLSGADYNPRKIDNDHLLMLQDSIKRIGIVKPIIARGNVIVAGHQRCKALKEMGIMYAPVYLLGTNTTLYDEVRFNQLHNGTDLDAGDEEGIVTTLLKPGFNTIKPNDLRINCRGRLSPVRHEIATLLLKYGNWGACVATSDGNIIHAAQYAIACKMTNSDLTVYCLDDSKVDDAKYYLNKQYGEFCYDSLPKTTYIQTYAQKYRLRTDKKGGLSRLYESMVIPWLKKNKDSRGLDFGCGQADYVKKLEANYKLMGLEFFYRGNGGNKININQVNNMIDTLISHVNQYGLLDFIVCDSVLNSVDSKNAESSVMAILNLFVKHEGIVFFSGRTNYSVKTNMNTSCKTRKTRDIEFLDKDGFSALYRKGHWFYQKFHNEDQIKEITNKAKFKILSLVYAKNGHTKSWQCCCTKIGNLTQLEYIKAINYEFNLPLPGEKTINRHDDIIDLMKKHYNFNQ